MEKVNFEEIFNMYQRNIEYANRNIKHSRLDNKRDISWFKGYKDASFRYFQNLRMNFPESYPEIRKVTEKEKEKFTIRNKKVADDLDVAINKVYGNTVEKNKEYEIVEAPYGVLEYRDQIIPVYSDDAGQQDYCIFKNHTIASGAYELFPVSVFVYEIDYLMDVEDED